MHRDHRLAPAPTAHDDVRAALADALTAEPFNPAQDFPSRHSSMVLDRMLVGGCLGRPSAPERRKGAAACDLSPLEIGARTQHRPNLPCASNQPADNADCATNYLRIPPRTCSSGCSRAKTSSHTGTRGCARRATPVSRIDTLLGFPSGHLDVRGGSHPSRPGVIGADSPAAVHEPLELDSANRCHRWRVDIGAHQERAVSSERRRPGRRSRHD